MGAGFVRNGHRVLIGSRSPGRAELVAWRAGLGERASTGPNEDAARFGEAIVFATRREGAENALDLAGRENLAGKIVIDTTNPIG